MTPDDTLAHRAFDPPFLGMPAQARHSGKAVDDTGAFLEIFLDVDAGMVRDAGFLTSIAGDALVCASLWCEAAVGKTVADASALTAETIAAVFPPEAPPRPGVVRLCLEAGRLAAEAALRQDDSPAAAPCPQPPLSPTPARTARLQRAGRGKRPERTNRAAESAPASDA